MPSPAFTTYGMADGLSQGTVEALIQDRSGFLWIGTHDGLNRFDGVRFRAHHARLDDPTSLGDDFVLALAQADDGQLWVGTDRAGLDLFDPLTGEARHFPLFELGPWQSDVSGDDGATREGRTISDIALLSAGGLLLLTDLGLAHFEPSTGSARLLDIGNPRGTDRRIWSICSRPNGEGIAGMSDGAVLRLGEAGSILETLAILPDGVAVVNCASGEPLVGTIAGEIYTIESDATSARRLARIPDDSENASNAVRDLQIAPDGSLWIATSRGAYRADLSTGSVRRVGGGEGDRGLPDSEVTRLLVDETGVLWVGTWNGLASLHPLSTMMRRVLSDRDLRGDGVIAMAAAPGGDLWVGTYGGGVQRLKPGNGGSVSTVSLPESLAGFGEAQVFGLAAGVDGELWVATLTRGILRLDDEGRARRIPIVSQDGHEVPNLVYSVFIDRSGEVWAGTGSLGLVRFDRERSQFSPVSGSDPGWDFGSDYVWPITEDESGRLWVGAYNGGLASVDRDRTGTRLYRAGPGGLSDDRILTLFVDSRQDVWVGTEGGGLNHFDPDTEAFTVYRVEDGLPHDNVEGIVEDEFGFLWVTTNNGLARFDRDTEEFLVFREAAGLAGNRFFANAAYRSRTGELYFGGSNGLTIVDPAAIGARGIPPRVALTGFRIQGREAPLSRAQTAGGLDLEPGENFFAFDFAAMDFADVTQNRYRYQLVGLDEDWVDAGNNPVANYTSVPAGRYVFRVAARNSEGVWNEDALSIPVRVQAPYYETIWFRVTLGLAALSLVMLFYLDRVHTLKKNQKVRLDVAGSLHDDIGADLSTIVLKAELIRAVKGLDERGRDQLADVGRLARDMANKVRETVWVVNTKYDTLASLVGKMRDTTDDILGGQVGYDFAEPEVLPHRTITMMFRNEVHLLFKEALHNVVKHAAATYVQIGVAYEHRHLRFRVSDDGVGFDTSDLSRGNGQQLMRERAEACRGDLRVSSQPGAGTTIELRARVK